MKPADERVHWSVKGRERGNTDGRGPSASQREGEGRRKRAWAAGLRGKKPGLRATKQRGSFFSFSFVLFFFKAFSKQFKISLEIF